MSLNSMGLGFVFTARDLATGTIRDLERSFTSLDRRVGIGAERLQGAFQQIGLGMSILSAGAVTVGASFALASYSGRFEQAIAAVGAVSGASASELVELRNAAIEAGVATQFSPTEATLGLRELSQAGFNARESIRLLIPTLDLAGGSLGELTPQQAAGLAAQAMNAFGLSVDEAGISVDRMLQAVNVFALNASELPLALGTASRGAQSLHQSLSETLIALGLVKNVIPSVERSSTAVAVAMERMANPDIQQRLQGIGVAVVDSSGRFRAFLDILGDMAPRLGEMTDAQRSAFLIQTFGNEAMGGLNAMLTQITNGIRTSTGETLRGAQAIGYLREQFEGAAGTAARFREQMLSTFEGQKRLLLGSAQTLGIVLGEPFAQVFRPIVGAIVTGLNTILGVFRVLPAPVKLALAALVLVGGVLVSLVGGAVVVSGAIALFATVAETLVPILAGVLLALAPVILAVGVFAGVIAAFAVAFRRNVGGIADVARRALGQITLGFRGLVQLVEQGGFSGAVREELGRAGNSGLRHFVVDVFRVVHRVRELWSGIAAGFTGTLDAAAPVFRELVAAFRELGSELGRVFGDAAGGAASLPSSQFRSFGQAVGSSLATVIRWLGQAATAVVRIGTGAVIGFRSVTRHLGPVFALVRRAITMLGDAWDELTRTVLSSTRMTGLNVSGWRVLGEVLGRIAGGALVVLVAGLLAAIVAVTTVVRAIAYARDVIVAVSSWVGTALGRVIFFFAVSLPAAAEAAGGAMGRFLARVLGLNAGVGLGFARVYASIASGAAALVGVVVARFEAMAQSIARVLALIRDSVAGVLRQVPAGLLPESLAQLARGPITAEMNVASQPAAARGTQTTAARSEAATSAMPAASEAGGRRGIVEQIEAGLTSLFSHAERRNQQPINVAVKVDGETIARATHNADQANAGRAFAPVPTY